jgi:hypothetical protein
MWFQQHRQDREFRWTRARSHRGCTPVCSRAIAKANIYESSIGLRGRLQGTALSI